MTEPTDLVGPPQDIDAEMSVLGGMLLAKDAVADAAEVVGRKDFYRPNHEDIFVAIMALYMRNEPADAVTVCAELARSGDLERVGGASYVHNLAHVVPSASTTRFYAELVKAKAVLRRLGSAGQQIGQLVHSGAGPADAVQQSRALVDACMDLNEGGVFSMVETIDETLTTLMDPPRFVATPWKSLNERMSGWRPGAQNVIGARPGIGKTVIGLQAALDLTQHGNVLFVSMEMSRHELQVRAISQIASVSNRSLDRHDLTDNQWQKIADARQFMDLRLFIDDRAMQTPTTIRSSVRTVARAGKLVGVVVDYVQLMTDTSGLKRNRQEQVAEFSRALKLIAKDFDVPVITLSQLNRQSEGRNDKRPQISDMRESGALEQDADLVLLLHRDMEKAPDDMHISVAKNRHGVTGSATFLFEGQYSRIKERPWTPYQNVLPRVEEPYRRDLD